MPDDTPASIAIDSCIVIDLFDEKSAHRGDIRQLFTDAEGGKLTLVISTMVHAEVAASSKHISAWQIVELRRALSQSYFEPVEISIPIALLASDLARENGLKPPDALHAATCVAKRVGHLLTSDKRLLKANGKILLDASDRSKTLAVLTPQQFCDKYYRPLFEGNPQA